MNENLNGYQTGLVNEDEELAMTECTVYRELGWVTVKYEDVLNASSKVLQGYVDFRNSVDTWRPMLKDEWYYGLRRYDRVDMVGNALFLTDFMGPLTLEEARRNITASGIIYEHAVPEGMFLLDEATVDRVLRYQVLTEPVQVLLDSMVHWQPYLKMPGNLADLVKALTQNYALMTRLFGDKKPPNLVYLRTHCGYPMNLSGFFEPDQLRKALTCMFLVAGLPVPRDYLYLDMDVHDYVKKIGEYEVTNPHQP